MDAEKLAMQRRIDTLDQHAIRLHAALTEYERENARLKAELETVKRERDAAVKDAKHAGCVVCKYSDFEWPKNCHDCEMGSRWEWRGLCESNGGANNDSL